MSTTDTTRQMSVMHISWDPLRRYASGKNSVICTLMDGLKRYHVPAFFLAPPQYSYKRILQRGISYLVGRFNSDKAKTWHLLKHSINPLLGSLAKASDRVSSNSVFHAHDIIAAWVVLSSLGEKVPLVITVHSFGPTTAEFERQGYFRDAPETTREFKRIESLTFAQARIITTPSEASRSEILRLHADLDPRKVRVVPNPVSPNLFQQPPLQKTQLDLPEDCVVVFTAAALVKSKRIDLLLHIAKMVVDNCDIKPYFLIAGKGPELRRLKEIARKLGIYRHVLFPANSETWVPILELRVLS
jgi:glycosyltransferase involved in cell wall biosynthesis